MLAVQKNRKKSARIIGRRESCLRKQLPGLMSGKVLACNDYLNSPVKTHRQPRATGDASSTCGSHCWPVTSRRTQGKRLSFRATLEGLLPFLLQYCAWPHVEETRGKSLLILTQTKLKQVRGGEVCSIKLRASLRWATLNTGLEMNMKCHLLFLFWA